MSRIKNRFSDEIELRACWDSHPPQEALGMMFDGGVLISDVRENLGKLVADKYRAFLENQIED